VHRRQVHRRILADRGVRAAAGLDPQDAIRRQRPRAGQELGVFARVDVVGDRGDLEALAQVLAQGVHQRRLAGPDRAADADAKGVGGGMGHVRNSLVYWVSWAAAAKSAMNVAAPMASNGSSTSAPSARRAAAMTGSRSAAITICPSVWPSGISR